VRSAANSGTGLKPFASFGVPMCDQHHSEQHRIGQPGFERKYNISLFRTAAAFSRQSPDTKRKEALRDVATQYLDPEFWAAIRRRSGGFLLSAFRPVLRKGGHQNRRSRLASLRISWRGPLI
jgi:hypothetical protein